MQFTFFSHIPPESKVSSNNKMIVVIITVRLSFSYGKNGTSSLGRKAYASHRFPVGKSTLPSSAHKARSKHLTNGCSHSIKVARNQMRLMLFARDRHLDLQENPVFLDTPSFKIENKS